MTVAMIWLNFCKYFLKCFFLLYITFYSFIFIIYFIDLFIFNDDDYFCFFNPVGLNLRGV